MIMKAKWCHCTIAYSQTSSTSKAMAAAETSEMAASGTLSARR